MTDKRGRGRPAKPPAEKYRVWHVTTPPEVAKAMERRRRDGETDSELVTRLMKETTMERITIEIDTSDTAMVGGDGWQDADPSASVTEFVRLVMERVAAEFPGYHIQVERTDHRNSVEFSDEYNDGGDNNWREVEERRTAVREIISDVYQSQAWVK